MRMLLPVTVLACLVTSAARSQERPAGATFALVIGVNSSLDPELAPLQYADDDAARYLDLFRALGARTYLVSRLDENTRRLHPQAAAEAIPPRRADLERAVGALSHDVAQAHAHGVRAQLYVVYAGHGNVRDARPSFTLEDGYLGGDELLGFIGRAGADESHLIVDACHAYLLAFQRGPGGERRPLHGFVALEAAARAGNVGYLLASSVSGESHEWAGFEAGVFSHEVRSGLYGAADADGDGRVTYAEIAAFVARANEAIAGERFRPQVLARAPHGGDLLLDLRARRDRELRLDEPKDAHYLLEDAAGVRLLDFHASGRRPVRLVRPLSTGPLYLRRPGDVGERVVPPSEVAIRLDDLPVEPAAAHSRGAAHHAFSQLFSLAFDEEAVARFRAETADAEAVLAAGQAHLRAEAQAHTRRSIGAATLGLGVGAAAAGAGFLAVAHRLHDEAPAGENQRDVFSRNQRIRRDDALGVGLLIGAGAAALAGTALLLWPSRAGEPALSLTISPTGVEAHGRF
jgi:hypothetical protein